MLEIRLLQASLCALELPVFVCGMLFPICQGSTKEQSSKYEYDKLIGGTENPLAEVSSVTDFQCFYQCL